MFNEQIISTHIQLLFLLLISNFLSYISSFKNALLFLCLFFIYYYTFNYLRGSLTGLCCYIHGSNKYYRKVNSTLKQLIILLEISMSLSTKSLQYWYIVLLLVLLRSYNCPKTLTLKLFIVLKPKDIVIKAFHCPIEVNLKLFRQKVKPLQKSIWKTWKKWTQLSFNGRFMFLS